MVVLYRNNDIIDARLFAGCGACSQHTFFKWCNLMRFGVYLEKTKLSSKYKSDG